MPRIALTAAFLALMQTTLVAQTKVEIATRLVGYDLRQAGEPSETTVLPRIVVTSGSEGTVDLSRPYTYPKEFNKKGKPTVVRTAYLGIRFPDLCTREQRPRDLSSPCRTLRTRRSE
jgi:hypothetical protein